MYLSTKERAEERLIELNAWFRNNKKANNPVEWNEKMQLGIDLYELINNL